MNDPYAYDKLSTRLLPMAEYEVAMSLLTLLVEKDLICRNGDVVTDAEGYGSANLDPAQQYLLRTIEESLGQ